MQMCTVCGNSLPPTGPFSVLTEVKFGASGHKIAGPPILTCGFECERAYFLGEGAERWLQRESGKR